MERRSFCDSMERGIHNSLIASMERERELIPFILERLNAWKKIKHVYLTT